MSSREELYKQVMHEALVGIRDALAAKDWSQMAFQAHSAKGSALIAEDYHLGLTFKRLEAMARGETSWDDVEALIASDLTLPSD